SAEGPRDRGAASAAGQWTGTMAAQSEQKVAIPIPRMARTWAPDQPVRHRPQRYERAPGRKPAARHVAALRPGTRGGVMPGRASTAYPGSPLESATPCGAGSWAPGGDDSGTPVAMSRWYQRALAFGMRAWVPKST